MRKEAMNILRSKFRGCLLGALFGDALGAEFEGSYWDELVPLEKFDELSEKSLLARKASEKYFTYTDDTAMSKAMCRSLLANKSFDIKEMAKEFVEEFFREPTRGYGGGVMTVFQRLRDERHVEDVTIPARKQFDGSGSYGNGAAMRVSPLALFYHNDVESLKKDSRQSALITHAHVLGIHGAVLQAIAVYEALNTSPGSLDVAQYIEKMITVAQELESGVDQPDQKTNKNEPENDKEEDNQEQKTSYVTQFEHIKKMLQNKPQADDVIKTLGNGVSAVQAVPAAIFSFLYKANTCLKDAIFYAISLGGDTDTIGSMTGAIAGAYWGDQSIPKEWTQVTESVNEVTQFADQLYDLRVKD